MEMIQQHPSDDPGVAATPDVSNQRVIDGTESGVHQELSNTGGMRGRLVAAKTSLEIAVVAAEITPLNEAMRFVPYSALVASHANPVLSGAALGAATLLVEGAAAISTADLLGTGVGKRAIDRVNTRLEKFIPKDVHMSPMAEAGVAYLGGTAVVLTEKQREDPGRTVKQNAKHGLLTAGWLSGTLATQGALLAEGIQTPDIKTVGLAALGVAGVPTLARWAKRRISAKERPAEGLRDKDKHYVHELVYDQDHLAKASLLEQDVWTGKGYGDLVEEGYEKYMKDSRTFASFDGDDECIGMTRMFTGNESSLPPFLEKMPFYDESVRRDIAEQCAQGLTEELGTTAVAAHARGQGVNTRLWRLAFRNARERGVESWGIIMEPERVEKMNRYHGFTFHRLGDAVVYQGGSCAAYIMKFEETAKNMIRKHPLSYYWFFKKSLKP